MNRKWLNWNGQKKNYSILLEFAIKGYDLHNFISFYHSFFFTFLGLAFGYGSFSMHSTVNFKIAGASSSSSSSPPLSSSSSSLSSFSLKIYSISRISPIFLLIWPHRSVPCVIPSSIAFYSASISSKGCHSTLLILWTPKARILSTSNPIFSVFFIVIFTSCITMNPKLLQFYPQKLVIFELFGIWNQFDSSQLQWYHHHILLLLHFRNTLSTFFLFILSAILRHSLPWIVMIIDLSQWGTTQRNLPPAIQFVRCKILFSYFPSPTLGGQLYFGLYCLLLSDQ